MDFSAIPRPIRFALGFAMAVLFVVIWICGFMSGLLPKPSQRDSLSPRLLLPASSVAAFFISDSNRRIANPGEVPFIYLQLEYPELVGKCCLRNSAEF
jgi:hypothetical protein